MYPETQGSVLLGEFPSRRGLAVAPLTLVAPPPVSWPGVPVLTGQRPVAGVKPVAFIVCYMPRYDLLEARSATAMTLRQLDAECRAVGITKMTGDILKRRKVLVELLKDFGGQPWPYSKDSDNSWVGEK